MSDKPISESLGTLSLDALREIIEDSPDNDLALMAIHELALRNKTLSRFPEENDKSEKVVESDPSPVSTTPTGQKHMAGLDIFDPTGEIAKNMAIAQNELANFIRSLSKSNSSSYLLAVMEKEIKTVQKILLQTTKLEDKDALLRRADILKLRIRDTQVKVLTTPKTKGGLEPVSNLSKQPNIVFEIPYPGIYIVTIMSNWSIKELEDFLDNEYSEVILSSRTPYVLVWDVSAVKGLVPAGTLGAIVRKAPTPPNEGIYELGRYGVGASEFIKQMGMMAARMKHSGHKQKYFKTLSDAIYAAIEVLGTRIQAYEEYLFR